LISCLELSAQSDYYWYRGKKVKLEKSTDKKFVLYKSEKQDLSKTFQASNVDVKKEGVTKVSKSIRMHQSYSHVPKKWAIVESSDFTQSTMASDPNVLYEGSFYKAKGKDEVAISHMFYVKLFKPEEIALLEEIAELNKTIVLGNNEFMPLWYTLECTKNSKGNSLEMANVFFETGVFQYAEPDFMADFAPVCVNDSYYEDQWGLNSSGQYGGTENFDINFCKAHEITSGDSEIIVAVIDHGIELDHPDLTNMSNLSFDTETGSSPSIVRGDHGTACSGIIGANADNEIGIAGIAPDCQLMSISNGLFIHAGASQDLADGINYAVNNGASVLSNSWGHAGLQSQFLDDAITNALTNGRGGLGCVVVFAAGNSNSDVNYPANSNDDIIAVGAASPCGERKSPTSCDGETWWGSCFGGELDVVAPGVLIPTTDRQGTEGYNPYYEPQGGYADQDYFSVFNGTSSAAPHVAAVAALILSVNPDLTQREVADIIELSAQKVGGYNYQPEEGRDNGTWHEEMGYGLLDAYSAVLLAQRTLCEGENVTVTQTMDNVAQGIFASNSITATNSIQNGSNVQYGASQFVFLENGFKVESGSFFEASLNGCATIDALHLLAAGGLKSQDENDSNSGNRIFKDGFIEFPSETTVYPNPTSGVVYINNLPDGATIEVYDQRGQLMLQGFDLSKIDLTGNPEGLFFVKIVSGDIVAEEMVLLQ